MNLDRMAQVKAMGEKGRCDERSGAGQEGRHCTQRKPCIQGSDQHPEIPGPSLVGITHYQQQAIMWSEIGTTLNSLISP